MSNTNYMTVSFTPFKDETYELTIQDGLTGNEVTLTGSTKYISEEQKQLLYNLAPMCVYTHYKEISNKEMMDKHNQED